ncbi:50S ribosomal protein L23 [Candidatus Gracilibacteria bacterium]|nr:50S ribosomal protein L23 [Candidatus Gracilibacteria bacterium]
MRLYTILQKPLVTEKTANMQMGKSSYAFQVAPSATKIDVKMAIKELYGVEVQSVNIINTRAKFKYGKKRGLQPRRRESKKAYITLKNSNEVLDVTLTK